MSSSNPNQDVEATAALNSDQVTSDTANVMRDNSAKRQCTWETNSMEDLNQDGFTLVQNKTKSKKNAVESASAQKDSKMQTQNSTATPVTHRLAFPPGMSPRDRTVWLAEVASTPPSTHWILPPSTPEVPPPPFFSLTSFLLSPRPQ